jgi:glycine cleavage system H protein
MERKPGPQGSFPVLPSCALPCVWMAAGLLTYRLCDRDYECDRCPLDAGIRGVELAPQASAAIAPAVPTAWGIRDDRRYHPAYGWVAASDEGLFRWGIDGLSARLFDRLSSVVLPAVGTELEKGQIACWVLDDGDLVPLRAPVSGRVIRTNQAVQRSPGLITSSPYDDGWLAEVRGSADLDAEPGLCVAAERRDSAAHQMAALRRATLRAMHGDPTVGPTAADGGERLTDMRRMLGTRRYHRLVLSILH